MVGTREGVAVGVMVVLRFRLGPQFDAFVGFGNDGESSISQRYSFAH